MVITIDMIITMVTIITIKDINSSINVNEITPQSQSFGSDGRVMTFGEYVDDSGDNDHIGDDDDNDEDCDEKKGFWYLTIRRGELSGFPESPDWLFDWVGIRILDKEGIKFGQRHIHNSPIRLFIPTISMMTKAMI